MSKSAVIRVSIRNAVSGGSIRTEQFIPPWSVWHADDVNDTLIERARCQHVVSMHLDKRRVHPSSGEGTDEVHCLSRIGSGQLHSTSSSGLLEFPGGKEDNVGAGSGHAPESPCISTKGKWSK